MVTTIQEVNVPLAFLYGVGDNSVEFHPRSNRQQGENPFTGFSDWKNALTSITDYSHLTNQDLIDFENERLSNDLLEVEIKNARLEIRTLSQTAVNFTKEVTICFNAIKQCQFDGDDTTTTFDKLIDALNDSEIGNGFRSTVLANFTVQTGTSINLLNLIIVTLSEKREFIKFFDRFFTSWMFMCFIGKTTI